MCVLMSVYAEGPENRVLKTPPNHTLLLRTSPGYVFCLLSITQGRSPKSLKICIQGKILQGKLEKQHSDQ